MTSTLRVMRVAALAILLGAGVVAQAEAVPIVSIDPVFQVKNLTDAVAVDIMVSGLTGDIGGFSAVLSFNDTILTGVSYVVDPDGNFDNDLDLSFGFTPFGGGGANDSPLDLFLVGDPSAAQPAAFRLARVNFLASSLGLSPLTLSGVVLSNADGTLDIITAPENGSVCVGDPGLNCQAQVPEPATFALIGAGLSALLARRVRKARQRA